MPIKQFLEREFGGTIAWLTTSYWTIAYRLGVLARYRRVDPSRIARLVFVCAGNVCRSPYAAHRALALHRDSVSCGLTVTRQIPADAQALHHAASRGIDLSRHQSRSIWNLEIEPTDLLIMMEPAHALKIDSRLLESGAQLTILGLWTTSSRIHIADPFGRSDAYFERCFEMIDRGVEGLIAALSSNR
jgi:protein-tyrosine phosphatase